MKSKIYIPGLLLCVVLSSNAYSQDIISLEDAIRAGLENNFGIRIAKNAAEITSINKNIGDIGFLPQVNLNGEYTNIDDNLLFTDEEMFTETNGYEEILYKGTGISLDWTIFEGFWKITNYKKLAELEKLGHVQAYITIENTLLDITAAYYNIVRHEKRIEVLNNTVEISEDRSLIARTKYELGAGSEYELLVTKTDLNVDRTEVIREKLLLYSARMELSQLLNLDTNFEFRVKSEIELNDILKIEDIKDNALEKNRQLNAAELRKSIASLEKKEIFNRRLPEISFGGGYHLNSENISSEILHTDENRDGFNYGLVARFNLFNGFKTNRQAQIAEINYQSSSYEEQQQHKLIETALLANYTNYRASIDLIRLEKENLELANQALEIALERFKLANITPVELRESQRTLLNTETRLITAMFEAKIYETELLRLSGKLLEQYNISPL